MVGTLIAAFFLRFEPCHTLQDVTKYSKFCLGTITTAKKRNGTKVVVDGHQMLTTLLLMLQSLAGNEDIGSNWLDYDSQPETWHYSHDETGCITVGRRIDDHPHSKLPADFLAIIETMYLGLDLVGDCNVFSPIWRQWRLIALTLIYLFNDRSFPLFVHWLLNTVIINEVKA
jgi:hypothetical protein